MGGLCSYISILTTVSEANVAVNETITFHGNKALLLHCCQLGSKLEERRWTWVGERRRDGEMEMGISSKISLFLIKNYLQTRWCQKSVSLVLTFDGFPKNLFPCLCIVPILKLAMGPCQIGAPWHSKSKNSLFEFLKLTKEEIM